MKRKTFALILATVMTLALLPAVGNVAQADDVLFYTLDGTVTSGTSGYDTDSSITQNGIEWSVTGNTTVSPWRIGGKSITDINGVNRSVYATTAMSETVTKVELELGDITITLNSLELIVTDSNYEVIETIPAEDLAANQTFTFTPGVGKTWENAYFEFVFNVTNKTSNNKYVQFKAAKFYKADVSYTITPETNNSEWGTVALEGKVITAAPQEGYRVSKTNPYTVSPANAATVSQNGNQFTVTASANCTVTINFELIQITSMQLKRIPSNNDVVVIYHPAASKVMAEPASDATDKMPTTDAVLTDNILAVPDDALLMTVSVDADGKYTFTTEDERYLYADSAQVKLVDEPGDNTLFRLEDTPGNDSYYVKCDSACYNNDPNKPQYLEYRNGDIQPYSKTGSDMTIYTFQFFSEDGEGPTPPPEVETLRFGKITDTAYLEDGEYLIVYEESGLALNGSLTILDAVNDGADVTISNGAIVADRNYAFTITAKEGGYSILSNSGKYIGHSGSKNTLNTSDDDAFTNAISFDDDGYANISSGEYSLRFNSASNQMRFRYYTGGQQPIALYKHMSNGFYLLRGTQWTIDEINVMDKFTPMANDPSQFTLETKLTAGEEIKVVYVNNGAITEWYPDGIGTQYTVDAAHSGNVTIYFKSSYQDAWSAFGGHFYIETLPTFTTQHLVLTGDIGVSFNMKLPNLDGVDYSSSYMTFSVANGTSTETVNYNEAAGDNTSKHFVCLINSIQMAEPITATFHYSRYGEDLTVEKTYSAETYINAYLALAEAHEATEPGYETETRDLVRALANYGYFVQHYLEAEKSWGFENSTADKTYKEMKTKFANAFGNLTLPSDLPEFSKNLANFSKITHSLTLDSTTTINVYLTENTHTNDLNTRIVVKDVANGTSLAGNLYHVEDLGSRWIVRISNIHAQDLDTMFAIEADGVEVARTSALCYANGMLLAAQNSFEGITHGDGTTVQWQNAAAAICDYNTAADAYKAAGH